MLKKVFTKAPLFPFLFALYPVVHLVSVNFSQIEPLAGLRTIIIMFIICLIPFLFFFAFTHSLQHSALYTFILLLFFFLIFFILYAPVYRALREIPGFGHAIGRHRYLILFTIVLMLTIATLLLVFGKKISTGKMNDITLIANLTITFLFLLPIFSIFYTSVKNRITANISINALPQVDSLQVPSPDTLPDIYFIVLDMNTNENVLRKLLDYDDSIFSKALEERGFYVSPCSQSNYDQTNRSLASILNMDYLQSIETASDPQALVTLIQHSKVQRMLESIGYTTYAFETDYGATELKYLDNYLRGSDEIVNLLTYPGVTSFESLILNISAGELLYENRDGLSKTLRVMIDAPFVKAREVILFTLENLPKVAKNQQPKFVFAHLLSPHDPFVFNRDGDPAYRRTPYTSTNDPEFGVGYGWDTYKKGYVDEVVYLHKRIIGVVDEILAQSEQPPVIIIQGDHGIPRLKSENAKFQILNAYFLPGVTDHGLYPTISPVNSFRIVFNNYFNSDYELLPDKSYATEETLILQTEPFPCP